jgi:hypothetical protein
LAGACFKQNILNNLNEFQSSKSIKKSNYYEKLFKSIAVVAVLLISSEANK